MRRRSALMLHWLRDFTMPDLTSVYVPYRVLMPDDADTPDYLHDVTRRLMRAGLVMRIADQPRRHIPKKYEHWDTPYPTYVLTAEGYEIASQHGWLKRFENAANEIEREWMR